MRLYQTFRRISPIFDSFKCISSLITSPERMPERKGALAGAVQYSMGQYGSDFVFVRVWIELRILFPNATKQS